MFLNHLYGGMDEPELKIIDVFVCKLRKKLAQATKGDNYIETVWGRGYVLRDPQEDAMPPQKVQPQVDKPAAPFAHDKTPAAGTTCRRLFYGMPSSTLGRGPTPSCQPTAISPHRRPRGIDHIEPALIVHRLEALGDAQDGFGAAQVEHAIGGISFAMLSRTLPLVGWSK